MTILTYTDWRDRGRTRSQLRNSLRDGSVVRLRRGVVTEAVDGGPQALHRLKIQAAASSLGPHTYFGHESAAVIHGLPLLNGRLGEVVAVRGRGAHGAITDTLHTRQAMLGPDDVTVVDGLPVTTLSRTVSDLIRRFPFPEAVMVADAVLAAGIEKSDLLDRTAKGRGCRMAASVVDFADPKAESPGESLSRVRIHRAGLLTPDLQHELYDDLGRFLGRVDFWWEEKRLAGEFDGMVKYSKLVPAGQTVEDVIRAEKEREQRILAAGVRVIRWTWRDLWNGQLEQRVASALAL